MAKEFIAYAYASIVACFGMLWYAINNAPVGYQDEKGFHYGELGD